jgi:hypothetical protein
VRLLLVLACTCSLPSVFRLTPPLCWHGSGMTAGMSELSSALSRHEQQHTSDMTHQRAAYALTLALAPEEVGGLWIQNCTGLQISNIAPLAHPDELASAIGAPSSRSVCKWSAPMS